MAENKIKVNSIEELVNKTKEYVASQGGADKVRIGNSSTSTGYWTHTKNGLVQSSKGGIEIELKGQNNSSIELFLESEGEEETKAVWGPGKLSPKLMKQALAELNKIIPNTRPEPSQDEVPNGENDFQPHSFNIRAIPCSSFEEVKKQIKDYYQKNQVEINKNPDFSRWIEVTEIGLFSVYSETDKNGENITSGPHNTATITLKETDRIENGKIVNERISLVLKVKSSEWGEWVIDWPEKELKNYWNSLVGKRENNDNSTDKREKKHNQERTEKLRQEIQELKTNNNLQNDPKIKSQIAKKEKELWELENKQKEINGLQNTSDIPWNLIFGIVGTGLVLILIAALIIRKRKKNKRL